MDVELKTVDHNQINAEFPEQNDPNYVKDRLRYTTWSQRASALSLVLAITQIVLAALQTRIHPESFPKTLLISGAVFLFAAIVFLNWSSKADKALKANTELFHPKVDDGLTRAVFVEGLLLVGLGVALIVNLNAQRGYSSDFVQAKSTEEKSWERWYNGRTQEGLDKFLFAAYITQNVLIGLQTLIYGFAARASFRCLKLGNRAMSYVVFLGNLLLLIFALCVVFYANHVLGYGDYPQIRAHFPMWNVKGLLAVGIVLSVVTLITFLVDHRGYRVGFLVIGFLLLFLLLLLINFTGFAFRNTREVYKYYKGDPNVDTCTNRMYLVDLVDLDRYGCPRKYTSATNCTGSEVATKWEFIDDSDVNSDTDSDSDESSDSDAKPATKTTTTTTTTKPDGTSTTQTTQQTDSGSKQTTTTTTTPNNQGGATTTTKPDGTSTTTNNQGGATTTTKPDGTSTTQTTQQTDSGNKQTTTTTTTPNNQGGATTTTTTNPSILYSDLANYDTIFASDDDDTSDQRVGSDHCLNIKCCGLLGQLYANDLLTLANFGLLTSLAGILSAIGCFYFWYVSFVDTARNRKKDFVWLGLMLITLVIFVAVFIRVHPHYVMEKLGSDSRHLEMFEL